MPATPPDPPRGRDEAREPEPDFEPILAWPTLEQLPDVAGPEEEPEVDAGEAEAAPALRGALLPGSTPLAELELPELEPGSGPSEAEPAREAEPPPVSFGAALQEALRRAEAEERRAR